MNRLRITISPCTGRGGSRTAPTSLPGAVDRVAQALLTPEQAMHPLFAETVEMFRRAESEVAALSMCEPAGVASKRKKSPSFRRAKPECY